MDTFANRYTEDSGRWNAVQARDARADGLFVYAVLSTKIYCRPVCKARRARRKNVTFFSQASDAEQAGFRACKRCKPSERGTIPSEQGIESVRRYIQLLDAMDDTSQNDGSRSQTPCLEQMASQAGLSKWHFHRLFKRLTGTTPMRYLERRQQLRSQQNLLLNVGDFQQPFEPWSVDPSLVGSLDSWDTGGHSDILDNIPIDLAATGWPQAQPELQQMLFPEMNFGEQEMLSWFQDF